MAKWHTLSLKSVKEELKTREDGLTVKESVRRLEEYGPNILPKKEKATPLVIFVRQFKSFLIGILFVAVIISAALGEMLDAVVILLILIANAVLGFVQEYRAEKALAALEQFTVPVAVCIRNGRRIQIPAVELVPGDLVILEEGKKVPADIRLEKAVNLRVNESMLTGESAPVGKLTASLGDVPVADRKNMAFMGTIITYGRGSGFVTGTGSSTEMGKIAEMIKEEEEVTPLQKKLNHFGKWIGVFVLIVAFAAFAVEVTIGGGDLLEMFLVAIALAVSAVPEGLPAVVTITLAVGMNRMSKRNSLVKRMSAVETLGSTTVICADKTGTMTTNEMTVKQLYCGGKIVTVSGAGFEPEGRFFGCEKEPEKDRNLRLLSEISAFCNNSELVKNGKWEIIGDPTEGALMVLAAKAGVWPGKMREHKRVHEVPFSSERKLMTVVYSTPHGNTVYTKGAAEKVLELCTSVYKNGRHSRLTQTGKVKIMGIAESMASDGLRVLGLAYKKTEGIEKKPENNLVFVGFAGMIDPPREEVKSAIKTCRRAGIRTVMITGDHKLTALAIGKELGLIKSGSEDVVTGYDFDKLSEAELNKRVRKVNIFARVSPEHKVRILDILRKSGHIVAMTGDGVNDAPALKSADIGVAMGIKGTDVAKEVADMVLLDDNFATIVNAVEEGRGIYDNIRKFVRFLISTNFDEIFLITTAVLLNLPLPLLPIQILWLNLLTDGLPAVALSSDPNDKDIMRRKPRNPRESILHRTMGFILLAGVVAYAAAMSVFLLTFFGTGNVAKSRAMAFSTAMFFELFLVFNCRSETRSVFRNNPLSNRGLVAAVLISVVLQFAIIYVPFLQPIFGTAPLGLSDWPIVLGFAGLALLVVPEIFRRPTSGTQDRSKQPDKRRSVIRAPAQTRQPAPRTGPR